MNRKIQIRVVGSSGLLCDGVIRILQEASDLDVIAVDHSLEPILTGKLAHPADILLIFCSLSHLPPRSFKPLSASLKDICAKTKVLFVANEWDEHFALWALKSGVKGFLIKERSDASALLQAIRSIASGESRFDQRAVSGVLDHIRGEGAPGHIKRAVLTKQELNVLSFVRDGYSNKEIAKELFVSELTVKSHIHRIFKKLGVMNRTQLILQRSNLRFMKAADKTLHTKVVKKTPPSDGLPPLIVSEDNE